MLTDSRTKLQIKGIRDGLLVTIGEGDWDGVQAALLTHIEERIGFFKGARLALDVSNRIMHAAEMGTLRDRLSDKGVALWAVLSSSPVTEQTAQTLGLATRIHTPKPERPARAVDNELGGDNAIFVRRTIRSGFRVASRGHVIVVGDVNPGGEISAGKSVIVWGKVRGSIQAGMEEPEGAVVCALELTPTLLRIGEVVIPMQIKKGKHQPEMVHLEKDQVIIEPWNSKDR